MFQRGPTFAAKEVSEGQTLEAPYRKRTLLVLQARCMFKGDRPVSSLDHL
jgi:hypothetical protein